MKTQTARLKILAVGPEQRQLTEKKTTRKVVLTVAEIAADNPFGNTKEPGNPFEVEVYNHNIENFQLSPMLIDQVADCELEIKHYKSNSGPSVAKFLVNDLIFRL